MYVRNKLGNLVGQYAIFFKSECLAINFRRLRHRPSEHVAVILSIWKDNSPFFLYPRWQIFKLPINYETMIILGGQATQDNSGLQLRIFFSFQWNNSEDFKTKFLPRESLWCLHKLIHCHFKHVFCLIFYERRQIT